MQEPQHWCNGQALRPGFPKRHVIDSRQPSADVVAVIDILGTVSDLFGDELPQLVIGVLGDDLHSSAIYLMGLHQQAVLRGVGEAVSCGKLRVRRRSFMPCDAVFRFA